MRSSPEHAGLRWDADDGLPRCVTSSDGTVLVRAWPELEGRGLWLRLPDGREIGLRFDAIDHPVLGRCDAIHDHDGEVLALSSRVDWRHPREIPALDRPGALPRGAGTALLNLLAWQATRAGTGPLRYHGPYPSLALWRSLRASFRAPAPDAQDRFLADAQARALAGRRGEIDVDFHPDPHAWGWPHPRICVQRRGDVVERVYLDGRPYDRGSTGPWRLDDRGERLVAVIALGTEIWCERLSLDPSGGLLDDPRPLPGVPLDLQGAPLPRPVVEVLGEVIAAQAPDLLAPEIRALLGSTSLRWGEPGDDLAAWRDGALE
ncbi:MAG: hypothetical protein KDK70_20870, partial [Myxococcales bacterium]|nr:hypothetical protein [Myxococcales bacterium]